jgi:hypothetical protein
MARAHDPGTDAAARQCLMQTLVGRGRIEEALREADTAATGQLPAADRVRFQAFKASTLASFGQLEAAADFAAEVRPLAEEVGDELAGSVCLATVALVTSLHGDFVGWPPRPAGVASDASCRSTRSESRPSSCSQPANGRGGSSPTPADPPPFEPDRDHHGRTISRAPAKTSTGW